VAGATFNDPTLTNIFSYFQHDLPALPALPLPDPSGVPSGVSSIPPEPPAPSLAAGSVGSTSSPPAAVTVAQLSGSSPATRAMFENLEHMKGLVRGVGEQLSTLTVSTAPAHYNDLSSKIQLVRQSLEQMQEALQVRMSTGDEILDPFEQVKVIYVRQVTSFLSCQPACTEALWLCRNLQSGRSNSSCTFWSLTI
jgi:hypothetical protein